MLRKITLALGLAALVGTAGTFATTSNAEAGWNGPHRVVHRTVIVRDGHWRPAHFAPRWHRHGCVTKRVVRYTPRGQVRVVKRVCR